MGDRLAGKVALITGAGSGLGRGIAIRFAREGAAVVLAGRTSALIEQVASEIGTECLAQVADVCDPASIAALFEATMDRFGRLDVLVNNAGVGLARPSEDLTLEEWRRIIDTNLTGPFLCSQAAARIMLPTGAGCIINIASITSFAALPMRAAYGASKGGVVALTHALAVEWGARGLRVNAIAPGFIRTQIQDDLVRRGLFPAERIAARAPLRRMGRPEDVAAAAVYLASEDAEWVTGETMVVDGGWLANGWVD
jgi:NAD(P)-dependent dehydrogenase (short-subunit alcohol dehydrogenase family)